MKIFTNKFALTFTNCKDNPHFAFELTPLSKAIAKLQSDGPLFAGQVFYVEADSTAEFADELYSFHATEATGEIKASLVLCFGDQETREEFIEQYMARFKPSPAAGGLVLNPEGELLLIFRNGLWDLPKGKIEKGEASRDAAWREVAEETGLKSHKITRHFQDSYHIFPGKKSWRLKKTDWYLMEVTDTPALTPQEEEGITEVAWKSLAELRNQLPDTYPLIQELIRQA